MLADAEPRQHGHRRRERVRADRRPVSGGWNGCPGRPRKRFIGLPPGVDSVQQRPVTPERRFGNLDQAVVVRVVDELELAARLGGVLVVALGVQCEVRGARLVGATP